MWARIAIVVAAAIAGGAVLGRTAINRKIEKRLPSEIETAKAVAIAELDKQVGQVVAERLISFAINLAIKTLLVGTVYLLFLNGLISVDGLKVLVLALIAAFIVRDTLKTLPFAIPAFQHIRRHRWRPRRALVEFIAGLAFERAYAEAMLTLASGPNRIWLAMSKYSAKSISTDVGYAVRDVAREVSFDRVKPRAIIAAIVVSLMFGAYSAFFALTVGAAAAGR